jgi:hypothetical protein
MTFLTPYELEKKQELTTLEIFLSESDSSEENYNRMNVFFNSCASKKLQCLALKSYCVLFELKTETDLYFSLLIFTQFGQNLWQKEKYQMPELLKTLISQTERFVLNIESTLRKKIEELLIVLKQQEIKMYENLTLEIYRPTILQHLWELPQMRQNFNRVYKKFKSSIAETRRGATFSDVSLINQLYSKFILSPHL